MTLMKENLQCLKDVSGWDIKKIDGLNVNMAFRGDINVSFNIDQLGRGGNAKVEVPESSDTVQHFTYLALTSTPLTGDVRSVCTRLFVI